MIHSSKREHYSPPALRSLSLQRRPTNQHSGTYQALFDPLSRSFLRSFASVSYASYRWNDTVLISMSSTLMHCAALPSGSSVLTALHDCTCVDLAHQSSLGNVAVLSATSQISFLFRVISFLCISHSHIGSPWCPDSHYLHLSPCAVSSLSYQVLFLPVCCVSTQYFMSQK